MIWRLFLAIVVLFSSSAFAEDKEPPPNKALLALFEREFQLSLQESPELATFIGVGGYNDKVTDLSPPAIARRKAHVRSAIGELQAFDAKRLNAQDRISRALMLENLRLTDGFNVLYGPLPFFGNAGWRFVGPTGGPQTFYTALSKAAPFRNARDYDDYLKRLTALPTVLEQMMALMRVGMTSGWMPPRDTMIPGCMRLAGRASSRSST